MSVARHTLFNVVGVALPATLTLVTVPIYLRVVGVERYGVLALCLSLLAFVGFTSLGVGPALNRGLAQLESGSGEQRSQLFWTGMTVTAALAVPAFPLALLLILALAPLLTQGSSISASEVFHSAPWLALLFSLSLFGGTVVGALQGRQRFGMLTLANLLGSTLSALLPLIAATLIEPRLNILIAALATATVVHVGVQFLFCWSAIPATPLRTPARDLIKPLVGYGSWMTLTASLAPIVLLADRFVVGGLVGVSAVSAYVIAFNLVSRVTMLAASYHAAALPRFAAATPDAARKLGKTSLSGLLLVLTPLCVALAAVTRPFFEIWLGHRISTEAGSIALVLIVGVFAHSIGHIPSTMWMGGGRPQVVSVFLLVTLPLYLVLLWLLAKHFGVLGAAAAWSCRGLADYSLFYGHKFPRVAATQVAACTALVICAVILGLTLSPVRWTYWLIFAVISLLSVAVPWINAQAEVRATFLRAIASWRKAVAK